MLNMYLHMYATYSRAQKKITKYGKMYPLVCAKLASHRLLCEMELPMIPSAGMYWVLMYSTLYAVQSREGGALQLHACYAQPPGVAAAAGWEDKPLTHTYALMHWLAFV